MSKEKQEKERFSFYTLVDKENKMVCTLHMWADRSMTLNVDRIVETKQGAELKSERIEIPAKPTPPTMQDLENKHRDLVGIPRLN